MEKSTWIEEIRLPTPSFLLLFKYKSLKVYTYAGYLLMLSTNISYYGSEETAYFYLQFNNYWRCFLIYITKIIGFGLASKTRTHKHAFALAPGSACRGSHFDQPDRACSIGD